MCFGALPIENEGEPTRVKIGTPRTQRSFCGVTHRKGAGHIISACPYENKMAAYCCCFGLFCTKTTQKNVNYAIAAFPENYISQFRG